MRIPVVRIAIGILLLALAGLGLAYFQRPAESPVPGTPLTAVRLVFGSPRTALRPFDGSATVSAGSIVRTEGWLFSAEDRVEGPAKWRCTTKPLSKRGQTVADRAGICADLADLNYVVLRTQPQVGVILYLNDAAAHSELNVHTAQGDLSVALAELRIGEPVHRLDGEATVELIPAPLAPHPDASEQDWPALAPAREGGLWIAWQIYTLARHQDRLLLSRWNNNSFGAPEDVSGPGDFYRPQVSETGDGSVWVTWAALNGDNWDLYARRRSAGTWSETQRLTTDAASDFNQRLARAPDGSLWLAWQGFRHGRSRIWLSRLAGDRWSEPVAISQEDSNSWEPALAADSRGGVTVSWDSFRLGSYNVYARSSSAAGELSPIVPVAATENFEAHSDIAMDAQDRAWIVWDDGGMNWGLDSACNGMRLVRNLGLRVLQNGKLLEPPALPMQVLDPSFDGKLEEPRVTADRNGRVWLFARYWALRRPSFFEIVALHQTATGWSQPVILPHSVGREYFMPSAASTADGRLWLAWQTDSLEPYQNPTKHDQVYLAAMPDPGPWSGAKMDPPPAFYEMPAPVPAGPARYKVDLAGKQYQVYWGDMHRHTDLSGHGFTDGSLEDSMRYALDVAQLDFLGSTDHAGILPNHQWEYMTGDDYLWWRIQKVDDLLFVPGVFLPIYGYERSTAAPAGHHNVFFLKRGGVPLPDDRSVSGNNTDLYLWSKLQGTGALTFPHTPGETKQPKNNWEHPNPDFEPLMEIYQGFRSSYEYVNAPPDGRIGGSQVSEPGHFYQDALKKGYRYGVESSSDHLSTHRSYTGVYAEGLSREALFDAMRKRHTFAASDKIVVDFRIGGHLMGEEFASSKPPELSVKVLGTARIDRIEVVRNNQTIYAVHPGTETASFRYRDLQPPAGTAYYYIRIRQQDQNMAWSSPIWVDRP